VCCHLELGDLIFKIKRTFSKQKKNLTKESTDQNGREDPWQLLLCEHLLISLTKGVGIREVILTNGCPGGESKCVVRVEECRGPVDCGCKLNPYVLKEGLCWERTFNLNQY
jgi:hypothetical protein